MEKVTPTGASPVSLPPYRPLMRIRGQHRQAVCPIGNTHTFMMHWDSIDQRTMPCLLSVCERCQRGTTRRPLSYLAVARHYSVNGNMTWGPAILEVPFVTGLALMQLRHQVVTLWRLRPRSKVELQHYGYCKDAAEMKPFDIVPPLMRLWRVPAAAKLRLLDPHEYELWTVVDD